MESFLIITGLRKLSISVPAKIASFDKNPENRGTPDIAKVAMFLLSNDSSYIHGENILVDGGVINSVLANISRS